MTSVTVTVDGLTVTASHPADEASLHVVLALVEAALHGHRYTSEHIEAALQYDDAAFSEMHKGEH